MRYLVGFLLARLLHYEWDTGGITAVALVVVTLSIYIAVRVVRARRRPGTTAPSPVTGPQPPAPVPVPPPAEKEPSHLGQAVAAVAIFGLVGALLWWGQDRLPGSTAASPANPASCSSSEHDELPREYKTSRAVSGYELCKALNQPDLALFLGTPGEKPTTASGSNTLVDKDPAPEAEVDFDTYTVQLSAGFKVSVAEWVALLSLGKQDSVKTFTVLGRPAVFSSSRAMRMNLDPVNGSSADGNGPPVRTLYVARDKGDRGGMYHIAVWSKSGALPTDQALVRIAEKVLPALSGR